MDLMTRETLGKLQGALRGALTKAAGITTATGIVGYSLEAPSLLLYPVPTPLRNEIPRKGQVTQFTGTAENWKSITAINSSNVNAGVGEGQRGGTISITEADNTAPYKTIGLENFVSFEAWSAAEGFEDVRATAGLINLQATMIQEENTIVNGNASLALGTTPTPVIGAATAGGSITISANCVVACVALTYDGYLRSTVSGGVVLTVTRTNADGTTVTFGGGSANGSALSAAATTTSGNQTLPVTVAAVKGAYAYAWFLGTDGTSANCKLAAITTVNKVTLTANAAGTQPITAVTADNSKNSLVFDGLLEQYTVNGYWNSLDGANLTPTNTGTIAEIDVALQAFWDINRMSPQQMWMGGQMRRVFNSKMLTSSGGLLGYRVNFPSGDNNAQGGVLIREYMNPVTGDLIKIRDAHPNMPNNTIMFDTADIPSMYQNGRFPVVRRIRTRREYYQIDWPLRSRQYESGVYAEEMLQVYGQIFGGVLANIGIG